MNRYNLCTKIFNLITVKIKNQKNKCNNYNKSLRINKSSWLKDFKN